MIDMFEILELPKEEINDVEQFTPLEEVETETVSKLDYDNLVKTVEELKNLITNN